MSSTPGMLEGNQSNTVFLIYHFHIDQVFKFFLDNCCRYLCDFVYYYSLYHGQGKAALIHVPASGSLTGLVPQLQTIIHALLRQMDTAA